MANRGAIAAVLRRRRRGSSSETPSDGLEYVSDDIQQPLLGYSWRSLARANNDAVLLNMRRGSDDSIVGVVPSDNGVDIPHINNSSPLSGEVDDLATYMSTGEATMSSWISQGSINTPLTAPAQSNQPLTYANGLITSGAVNNFPSINLNGIAYYLETSVVTGLTLPLTYAIVFRYAAIEGNNRVLFDTGTGTNHKLRANQSSGNFEIVNEADSVQTVEASSTNLLVYVVHVTSTNVEVQKSSGLTTVNLAMTAPDRFYLGGTSTSNSEMEGQVLEYLVFDNLNPTRRTQVFNNLLSYYIS